MKTRSILILLMLVVISGWWIIHPKPPPKEPEELPGPSVRVEGQVFVVTDRGESLKLGAVTVLIVDKIVFSTALKKAAAMHKDEIKKDDDMMAFFLSEEVKMGDVIINAKSDADRRLAVDVLKTHGESRKQFSDLKRQEIDAVFDEAMIGIITLTSTRTDADGKFQIEEAGEAGKFCVLTHVKRKIDGDDRSFVWVFSDIKSDAVLLMSSDNTYPPSHLGLWP